MVIPLICLIVVAAIGVAATLGIASLSETPPNNLSGAAATVPALAQPQRHADIIPTGFPGFVPALIVDGSSRLVGQTSAAFATARRTHGSRGIREELRVILAAVNGEERRLCVPGVFGAVPGCSGQGAMVSGSPGSMTVTGTSGARRRAASTKSAGFLSLLSKSLSPILPAVKA